MDNVFVINKDKLISYIGKKNVVEIPDQVVVIAENAFYKSDVHRIIVGSNVKRIESSAFHCCGSLKEIVLPDGIESIGEMIYKCNQLKWIFANSGTVGEEYAVNHGISAVQCNCLNKDWYISNGKILKCFLKNNETISIPLDGKCIGSCVFENFRKLVSIAIPDSVSIIGSKAFRNCTSLESVVISNSVTSIGGCAFESCSKLRKVILSSSLKTIWGNCFNGCASLREIVVPEGCNGINGLAFANCKSLKMITIPESVSYIQDNAFLGCSSKLVLKVRPDSFALKFAKKHNLNHII